jgi:ankyrin repeat protein
LNGETPLHYAAAKKNAILFDLLMERKDINPSIADNKVLFFLVKFFFVL